MPSFSGTDPGGCWDLCRKYLCDPSLLLPSVWNRMELESEATAGSPTTSVSFLSDISTVGLNSHSPPTMPLILDYSFSICNTGISNMDTFQIFLPCGFLWGQLQNISMKRGWWDHSECLPLSKRLLRGLSSTQPGKSWGVVGGNCWNPLG